MSFCGTPLYIAAISPLSSTRLTVFPLKLICSIPSLTLLTISRKIVVFPAPGGDAIRVLYILFSSIFNMYLNISLLAPIICLAILKLRFEI